MADLAKLAIAITADPTNFESGMLRASQSAERMVASVTGQLSNLGTNFASIGRLIATDPMGAAVAGAVALGSAIRGLVEDISALSKEGEKWSAQQASLMRRMGITAEAAAGLQLQARQLGMEVGQLRTLFGTFSMRLGQAAAGSTEMTHALEEIGLSARALQDISPDQALQRIGVALQSVSNQGHRAQLTMSILGRRALELEPILSGGAIWGANAQQQAKAWGLVVDEATQKTIKAAVVAAAGADSALFSIRQSIANAVAAATAPARQFMSELTVSFVNFAQGPLGLIREAIGTVGGWINTVLGGIREALQVCEPVIAEIKKVWAEVWTIIKSSFGSSEEFGEALRTIAKVVTAGILIGTLYVVDVIKFMAVVIAVCVDRINAFWQIVKLMVNPLREAAALLERMRGGSGGSNAIWDKGPLIWEPWMQVAVAVKTADANAMSFLEHVKKAIAELSASNLQLNIGDAMGVGDRESQIIAQIAAAREEAIHDAALAHPYQEFGILEVSREENERQLAARIAILAKFDMQAAKQLEAFRAEQHLNDLLKDRVKILDGLTTPLGKFEDQIASINEMMVRGWFGAEGGIDFEQGAQAIGQAFEQIDRAQARHGVQLSAGLAAGSTAAISLINQSTVQQNNDPAERLRQIAAESLATQLRQEALGRQVLAATQQIANQPEPEVFDGN